MNINDEEKHKILNRLRRLEGQVRGLQRMIDEDRECHDVLMLLAGVRKALDATGDVILEKFLDSCQADFREGRGDIQELISAVRLARG
ncbi:MAG TPA: metal-sensitive transcriptional regulator [Trueperaceae bacterium]|nr:metal-sensitive transcriptional regulator [Trueperaceae bacterium]